MDLVNPDSFSVGERLPSLRRTLHTGKVWPEQGDMAYVAIKVFLQPANDVVVHAATARFLHKLSFARETGQDLPLAKATIPEEEKRH